MIEEKTDHLSFNVARAVQCGSEKFQKLCMEPLSWEEAHKLTRYVGVKPPLAQEGPQSSGGLEAIL